MQKLTKQSWVLAALMAAVLCPVGARAQATGDSDKTLTWPKAEDARPLSAIKASPTLDTVRQLAKGQDKLDVYQLIGFPQYHEGMAGVHEWNYVLKLRGDASSEVLACQLKVLYDGHMKVSRLVWRDDRCASLVAGAPPQVKAPPSEPPAKNIELSADALFAFDSAKLSAKAPEMIDHKVLDVINTQVKNVESIRVIGTTDRLGSDAYNLPLSRKRAEAVRNYLIAHGIPKEAIYVEGAGKAQPGTPCNQSDRTALIACLAPDRKVTVSVVAQ